MFENLLNETSFWHKSGQMSDIVLSTRLSLLRNQSELPFSSQYTEDELEKIRTPLVAFKNQSKFSPEVEFYKISDVAEYDRRLLRELDVLSEEMEKNSDGFFAFHRKGHFSMTGGGRDHYTIQVIRPGMAIYDGYKDLVAIDDEFNNFVPYAFSDKFGYLTSDLDNSGTGLKIVTLLHLPILNLMGTITEVKKMSEEIGAVFSSVTGDKNKNYGSFYTVTNKGGAGQSEMDIIELVDDVVKMIVDLETETRDDYVSDFSLRLEDLVWRSYGILKYARSISYVEALEYLSTLRLGVILSIIKDRTLLEVNDLLIKIQPAHLHKIYSGDLAEPEKLDYFRAEYIRTKL